MTSSRGCAAQAFHGSATSAFEERPHQTYPLNQSITHDLGATAWSASAVRLQECDQLLAQRVAR